MCYLGYGIIEGRDESGHTTNNYEPYDLSMNLIVSMKAKNSFSFGVTSKFIHSRIYNSFGNGVAFDLGILSKTPIRNLQFGFVVVNLGKGLIFIDELTKFPTTIKLGSSYQLKLKIISFTSTIDMVKELNSYSYINTGFEMLFSKYFAVRSGYNFNPYQKRITHGFGIYHDISISLLKLDYAYANYGDVGTSHRFSVTLQFNGNKQNKTE